MKSIHYERHFISLAVAAAALFFVMQLSFPPWLDRFTSLFALTGALHALAVVVSLRGRVGHLRQVSFIGLTALLNAATPLLALWIRARADFGDTGNLGLLLVLVSAFGACGYWLLIRALRLVVLRFPALLVAIALCVGATLFSFFVARRIPMPRDIADILPIAAWWAAFSMSLYVSDRDEGHSSPAQARETHV